MIPEQTTLGELATHYDAFVLDQFGVLLTGDSAYDFAPRAVKKLRTMGKLILMLSNSGKRASANEARLNQLGFHRDDYVGVLSSGEAAYKILAKRIGQSIDPGTKVFLTTRSNDTSCIDGLDLVRTDDASQAGLVILAGSQGDVMSLQDYEQILTLPAKASIPCLCTNPDLTMLAAEGLRFGCGRIAKLYEELGGEVEWIGKPHRFIYEMATQILTKNGAQRIVCIGDSPDHDIVGGSNAGFDTVLVRTGIHADEPLDEVIGRCRENGCLPNFLLSKFEF